MSPLLSKLWWLIGQWKWFAIIGLSLTLLSWIFQDWSVQRITSQTSFRAQYDVLTEIEERFSTTGREIFSISNSGEIIAADLAEEFRELSLELLDQLIASDTPSREIENANSHYRLELSQLAGSLSNYEPSVASVESVLNEAVDVDAAALAYKTAANRFLNSTWRSFFGTF